MLRKYFFFANYLFPSSKEVFLHNFRQFLRKLVNRPENCELTEMAATSGGFQREFRKFEIAIVD